MWLANIQQPKYGVWWRLKGCCKVLVGRLWSGFGGDENVSCAGNFHTIFCVIFHSQEGTSHIIESTLTFEVAKEIPKIIKVKNDSVSWGMENYCNLHRDFLLIHHWSWKEIASRLKEAVYNLFSSNLWTLAMLIQVRGVESLLPMDSFNTFQWGKDVEGVHAFFKDPPSLSIYGHSFAHLWSILTGIENTPNVDLAKLGEKSQINDPFVFEDLNLPWWLLIELNGKSWRGIWHCIKAKFFSFFRQQRVPHKDIQPFIGIKRQEIRWGLAMDLGVVGWLYCLFANRIKIDRCQW